MEGDGNYILGLDLGVASVGWAVLPCDERNSPVGVAHAGVRIFTEGLDKLEKGKGVSRNVTRRDARLRRRQLERRARRRAGVFRQLVRAGLLPAEPLPEGASFADARHRHAVTTSLYGALADKLAAERGVGTDSIAIRLPYLLRSDGLVRPLSAHELGLALYHISSRRGFQSNRKDQKADDKERGLVKEGIAKLKQSIASGHRTLGAFLATLDPHAQRIRGRYTARDMLKGEFDAIVGVQSGHYPEVLTEGYLKSLRDRIFHQRPMRSAEHLVGQCELEPKRKRARTCLPSSQRFRLLQTVNHLRVSNRGKSRPLSAEEREKLLQALASCGDLKAAEAKKLLGLGRQDKFKGDDKGSLKLVGDRTAAKLAPLFGDAWAAWSLAERDAVVLDLESIVDDEAVYRRAIGHYSLSEENARKLAELALEDSYMRLSTVAITRLTPAMEAGAAYSEAVKQVYPHAFTPKEARDSLPPVREVLVGMTNPLVTRTLTELRRVVNAIVATYGKPSIVRVELGRDLKNNADKREKILKDNRARERKRDQLQAEIIKAAGIAKPSRSDVEKAALWHECCGVCPYTGKSIALADLFGPSPRFDIEHIIPFSRSLDDSFSNKTLCDVEENRNVKGQRAPSEAYSPERLAQILARIEHWKGAEERLRDAKYRRFAMTPAEVAESFEDFSSRQLNDTRYASREAARYLGELFGGGWDAEGSRRVQVSAGQVTAKLRDAWDLNGLLSASGLKTREDHRHHAIDAVCVALTTPGIVKALADGAAARVNSPAETRAIKRGKLILMAPPFPELHGDLRRVLDEMIVSQRPQKAAAGALHEATHYSPPLHNLDIGNPAPHIRKKVEGLSPSEVQRIVDVRVREAVIAALGGKAPEDAFKDGKTPMLTTRSGTQIPIRSVRVVAQVKTQTVAGGERERHIKLGSNDHTIFLETKDKKGRMKWEDRIVTVFDARQRKSLKHPVIQRDYADGRFVMALREGDLIELDEPGQAGVRLLWRLRSISKGDYELQRPNDARKKEHMFIMRLRSSEHFRTRHAVRVTVDPLGRRIKEHGRQSD